MKQKIFTSTEAALKCGISRSRFRKITNNLKLEPVDFKPAPHGGQAEKCWTIEQIELVQEARKTQKKSAIIPATEISATITEQVPRDPAAVVHSLEAANLLPEPQEGKKITPSTEQGAPIISSNKSTAIIAQGGGFVQHLENLPEEIFSAPRFFKVNPDKTPAIKAWQQPNNQKLCTAINGSLVGFDISGHGRGEEYALLDFDHVLNPSTGEFVTELAKSWYQWIRDTLKPCYCERSISGDGLHIIIKPTPDKFKRIVNKDGEGVLYLDKNFDAPSTTRAKIEIFHKQSARYCLLTGNLFETTSRDITSGEGADQVLETLLTQIKLQYQAEHPTPKQKPADTYKDFAPDIKDLINRINTTVTPAELEAKNYLHRSEHGAPHPTGYICPWCNSGTHEHKTGALTWYDTPTPHFTCHAHSCGGDIIKFLSKVYGIDNHGKDFFTLLKRAADEFGITYDPKIFEPRTFAAMDDDEYDDDPTAPRTQDRLPDCPVNLRVPAGFTISNRGIWYEMPARKQGAEPKLIKVANTPIIPTKAFREHGNGITSYEVAIKKKGKWWRATVDGRTLQDPRKVLDLANDSASILEPRLLPRFFADTLIDINLPETTVYNQPGWHGDHFIDPCGGDGYRVCRAGFDYQREFETKGDPELLKKYFIDACNFGGAVARIFSGTSLAAPLIRRLNAPNAQIQLNSTSGGGKTALNKINAAIFGNPLELIRTFAATEKNRQAVAAAYNDLPSFFDEMETMTGKRAEEQLSQMIYSYSEGKGNQANKRNGEARQAFRFYGSRLMTAERPILKENDPLGAYKRLNQFRPTKLFDDDFAGELHIIAENNYGHFRRTWTNFIAEHIDEIKFIYQNFNKFFIGAHRELNPTQVKGITLAAIALQFFLVAIGAQDTFNDQAAEQDINSAISMLPTAAELSDTHRAIKELNSYVASHEKSFIRPVKDIDTGNIIEIGTSTPVCLGKIFDTGEVAFFPTELRKILVDELKFTNADKLISEWNDQGDILITKENRTTDVIKIDKKTYRVIHFKANIITSDIDSAETTYYEDRVLL